MTHQQGIDYPKPVISHRKHIAAAFTVLCLGVAAFAQQGEKATREFANLEIQVSLLRSTDVKAFASDLSSKPGIQPKFRFGKENSLTELTWSFVERSEFGDIYKFTKVGPPDGKERQISQREVIYTGRETIIWQDEEQRIVLKPKPVSED